MSISDSPLRGKIADAPQISNLFIMVTRQLEAVCARHELIILSYALCVLISGVLVAYWSSWETLISAKSIGRGRGRQRTESGGAWILAECLTTGGLHTLQWNVSFLNKQPSFPSVITETWKGSKLSSPFHTGAIHREMPSFQNLQHHSEERGILTHTYYIFSYSY